MEEIEKLKGTIKVAEKVSFGRGGIPPDNLLLDEKFREVMVGCLLGDGYIYIPKDYRNGYYGEHAGNIEYLKWKVKLLSKWLRVRLYTYNIKSKFPQGGEKVTLQGFLSTNASQSLTYLRKIWYPNGKKIPESELRYLNSLGLAIWFCDDGSHYDEITFHTNGFSFDDLYLLQDFLYKKFNIKVRIEKTHTLKINRTKAPKFINLIEVFVPGCMSYKLKPTLKRSSYMSIEHKNKISIGVKRAWQNPVIKEKFINSMRGVKKNISEEFRQKLREKAKTLVFKRWRKWKK